MSGKGSFRFPLETRCQYFQEQPGLCQAAHPCAAVRHTWALPGELAAWGPTWGQWSGPLPLSVSTGNQIRAQCSDAFSQQEVTNHCCFNRMIQLLALVNAGGMLFRYLIFVLLTCLVWQIYCVFLGNRKKYKIISTKTKIIRHLTVLLFESDIVEISGLLYFYFLHVFKNIPKVSFWAPFHWWVHASLPGVMPVALLSQFIFADLTCPSSSSDLDSRDPCPLFWLLLACCVAQGKSLSWLQIPFL